MGFLVGGVFQDHNGLTFESVDSQIPLWTYLHIPHFLNNGPVKYEFSRDLTSFQSLCTSDMAKMHLISIINWDTLAKMGPPCAALEKELAITLDEEEWKSINFWSGSGSRHLAVQKSGYKIKMRWYKTPLVLYKRSVKWRSSFIFHRTSTKNFARPGPAEQCFVTRRRT